MAFELPAKSPAIGTPKLSRSYETAKAALAKCACVGSKCRQPGDRAEAMASDALQVAAAAHRSASHVAVLPALVRQLARLGDDLPL
jgi:hypothetical protein